MMEEVIDESNIFYREVVISLSPTHFHPCLADRSCCCLPCRRPRRKTRRVRERRTFSEILRGPCRSRCLGYLFKPNKMKAKRMVKRDAHKPASFAVERLTCVTSVLANPTCIPCQALHTHSWVRLNKPNCVTTDNQPASQAVTQPDIQTARQPNSQTKGHFYL